MSVSAADLLLIPPGGVTRAGLELNIRVATLFIHSWLAEGRGCFALDGRAEDSATAEISRSQVESIIYLALLNNESCICAMIMNLGPCLWQVWQWIRHGARLEEGGVQVTGSLVRGLVAALVTGQGEDMEVAGEVFMDIVTRREMPEFITTLLSDSYYFRFSCHHSES